MRSVRLRPTGRAVGVLLLALVLIASACGGDDDDSSSSTSGASGKTLDQTLVFGGPPECLERPLCLGDTEKSLYNLDFKEVKKLDPGGPITVKALQDGTIQVGLLFTGSSVIDKDFVLLEDDKGLQPADNPTAIINKSKATPDVVAHHRRGQQEDHPRRVQQDGVVGVQRQGRPVDGRGRLPQAGGLDTTSDKGAGTSLTVGSKDFAGAQLLSQAYGQALKANGYDISFKDNIGPTETVYPLVKDGTIDLYGEFTGTFLTFLGGTASADSQKTYDELTAKLESEGGVVVATTPATAQDVNGFYVTKETADKYNLKTVSDLKQPAP